MRWWQYIELSVWKASVSDLIRHQQCVCGCFWLAGQGREGSRALVISECIWWLAAQLLDKKPKHSSCSDVCIQYLYIYKYLFLSFFSSSQTHLVLRPGLFPMCLFIFLLLIITSFSFAMWTDRRHNAHQRTYWVDRSKILMMNRPKAWQHSSVRCRVCLYSHSRNQDFPSLPIWLVSFTQEFYSSSCAQQQCRCL